MVRIINYKKRQAEDGRAFLALEVSGGIEMVKSNTGQFYATVRKTLIASTLDEETCKALLGTELPGSIAKVSCAPYEYTIKETGEITVLNHKYVYEPEAKTAPIQYGKVEADIKTFSMNEELADQPI